MEFFMSFKMATVAVIALIASFSFATEETTQTVPQTVKTMQTFDSVEVVGANDNPTPSVVTATDNIQTEAIAPEKSFKDALKVNADKEMMSGK